MEWSMKTMKTELRARSKIGRERMVSYPYAAEQVQATRRIMGTKLDSMCALFKEIDMWTIRLPCRTACIEYAFPVALFEGSDVSAMVIFQVCREKLEENGLGDVIVDWKIQKDKSFVITGLIRLDI
jgi:hypothetical protein